MTNRDQWDTDGDGIGDACEDEDGDGVRDPLDNCPGYANDQRDTDHDGLGDACDADDDGDTVPDASDNCPLRPNFLRRADADGDGVGDVCDNCPGFTNTYQEDRDRDGVGNACDTDVNLMPGGISVDMSIRGGPGQLQRVPIAILSYRMRDTSFPKASHPISALIVLGRFP
ncbi:MAG: thrombospondin type 3 repeat-containing protein [Chloroflexota bacterium]